MPFRSNATFSVVPGSAGTVRSRPRRADRFRAPRVTSVDAPSGATSQRRAITWPLGDADVSRRSTRGRPSTQVSAGTSNSKQADRASSSRWSGGRSAALPKGKKRPASTPVCCGDRTGTGVPWSAYVIGVTEGEGQAGSPTQRPGSSS